jgi:hypothetical protein
MLIFYKKIRVFFFFFVKQHIECLKKIYFVEIEIFKFNFKIFNKHMWQNWQDTLYGIYKISFSCVNQCVQGKKTIIGNFCLVSQQNRKFLCNRILFVDAYCWTQNKIKHFFSLGLALQYILHNFPF